MKRNAFRMAFSIILGIGMAIGSMSCSSNEQKGSKLVEAGTNVLHDQGSTSGNNGDVTTSNSIIADHLAAGAFNKIPAEFITAAKNNFRIFYGHTSHGNQIMVGLRNLAATGGAVYQMDSTGFIKEHEGDLGTEGDVSWADTTREALQKADNDRNVVMWSWCGGVSGSTEENINKYLNAMSNLEQDFPSVRFIYMTGHLDGSGDSGDLRVRNRQIRNFCKNNKKVLFDFEDIESYDLNGQYYPDESDGCNWCEAWCKANTCPTCTEDCDHSHCLNCNQKGKAFWWMMARLAGWTGN